ncbi:unnamed protein product [Staurois parvus]|uniref:Uncharacterized protein n=1 Tax=Staurois parvus TaxID=386267 RepID=A0ABN9ELW4_9NEOB|nr:unnamed protein product [Staurois parvus]
MQSGKYRFPATIKPRHIQWIARQRSMIHYSREHVSTALESSGGLVTSVVPSCFHFVIIPLTVERGIFSSQEMSRMDLLPRWQPITGPRLESLSS